MTKTTKKLKNKITKAEMLRQYFKTTKRPKLAEARAYIENKGEKLSSAQYYQIRNAFKTRHRIPTVSPAKQKATAGSDAGVWAIQFRDELAKLKTSMGNKISPEALTEACRSVFKI